MRLLLILALVFASVTFGPPASAQARHEMAHHHSHATDGDHQHRGHEDNRGNESSHAVAHVCPGCAVIGLSIVADAGIVPAALPRLPANPTSMQSFQANPIPPPPRFS